MKTDRLSFLFLCLALLSLLAIPALAENRAGALSLTPSIGGYIFEGDQNIENDLAYGLSLGYNLTENWGAELAYHYINTESEVGTKDDLEAYLIRLNALYNFTPEKELVPYLAAGVGSIFLDPDTKGGNTDFLFNYGGGLKYFLTEDLALQGDLRHIVSVDDHHNNLIYTVGLTYLLGGHKSAMAQNPAPMAEPVPEAKPMAAPAPQAAPEPTPEPEPAPAPAPMPMPMDSDGDGVTDDLDKCPDTPKGTAVDEKGCPLTLTLHINFDFDSAEIKPGFHAELQKAAGFIKSNQGLKALIAGHTDSRGADSYNMRLSERRAKAVLEYLVANFGIDRARLKAKGYGETQPVAENDTEKGRAANRRVEIVCCYVLPE